MRKNHFNSALLAVIVSMSVISLAFMSESNDITGFAVSEEPSQSVHAVAELKDFKSLETLSPVNYYVNGEGIVYWLDDSSLPVVVRIRHLQDDQRGIKVYVDSNGNVGYIISN